MRANSPLENNQVKSDLCTSGSILFFKNAQEPSRKELGECLCLRLSYPWQRAKGPGSYVIKSNMLVVITNSLHNVASMPLWTLYNYPLHQASQKNHPHYNF